MKYFTNMEMENKNKTKSSKEYINSLLNYCLDNNFNSNFISNLLLIINSNNTFSSLKLLLLIVKRIYFIINDKKIILKLFKVLFKNYLFSIVNIIYFNITSNNYSKLQ